ncbi:MAG: hypothetical protein IPG06_07070 [Haliea sp.]|nr:hypothetical protein [Haliea sp.]
MFRIFFPPAGLATSDRKMLLLLAAAFSFAQYDMSVLSLALPDMQATFAIAEEDLVKCSPQRGWARCQQYSWHCYPTALVGGDY